MNEKEPLKLESLQPINNWPPKLATKVKKQMKNIQ